MDRWRLRAADTCSWVLRFLRLLRGRKLFRYSTPLAGVAQALTENRLLYVAAFLFLGTATILGGVTIYLVEGNSNPDISNVGDGLWWAQDTRDDV